MSQSRARRWRDGAPPPACTDLTLGPEPQELALTPASIAAIVGGELAGRGGDRAVAGFSFDTRTLAPGELFFAIRGARDGNAFVRAAMRAGAAGAVISDRGLLADPELEA